MCGHADPAEDIHSAVEIDLGGTWVLVDATQDRPLRRGGLSVAEWDGQTDAAPAYPLVSPRWRDGEESETLRRIDLAYRGADQAYIAPYRRAFNAWLDSVRRG